MRILTALNESTLTQLYASFNAHDTDAVLAHLHPQVDWPNAWEGGRVTGHQEVRDYWARQWRSINARVEPTRFATTSDGRTAVDVHQVAHDTDGKLLGETDVVHVYAFDDAGLVTRMDVVEPA